MLDDIGPRMSAVHLSGHAQGEAVTYRPKFTGLVSVWMIRRLSDEQVTFAFEQQGPVTEVRVTGKLHDRAHAKVTEAPGGHRPYPPRPNGPPWLRTPTAARPSPRPGALFQDPSWNRAPAMLPVLPP